MNIEPTEERRDATVYASRAEVTVTALALQALTLQAHDIVSNIRELHQKRHGACDACGEKYPCSTVRVIEGESVQTIVKEIWDKRFGR